MVRTFWRLSFPSSPHAHHFSIRPSDLSLLIFIAGGFSSSSVVLTSKIALTSQPHLFYELHPFTSTQSHPSFSFSSPPTIVLPNSFFFPPSRVSQTRARITHASSRIPSCGTLPSLVTHRPSKSFLPSSFTVSPFIKTLIFFCLSGFFSRSRCERDSVRLWAAIFLSPPGRVGDGEKGRGFPVLLRFFHILCPPFLRWSRCVFFFFLVFGGVWGSAGDDLLLGRWFWRQLVRASGFRCFFSFCPKFFSRPTILFFCFLSSGGLELFWFSFFVPSVGAQFQTLTLKSFLFFPSFAPKVPSFAWSSQSLLPSLFAQKVFLQSSLFALAVALIQDLDFPFGFSSPFPGFPFFGVTILFLLSPLSQLPFLSRFFAAAVIQYHRWWQL